MKAFVWERMCDLFLLIIDTFDACVLLEVVRNSLLLLCTSFYTDSLSVLTVYVLRRTKVCINVKALVWEHVCDVFLFIVVHLMHVFCWKWFGITFCFCTRDTNTVNLSV